MPDVQNISPQDLYRQWRNGDAASGQAMAQRFSDWYYSLVSVRLGDIKGKTPLQRSCLRFQQGISTVSSPAELVDWAHALVAEEMKAAGDRVDGGDFPSQLTGGRSPGELLRQVARTLPPEDIALLAHAFDARYAADALSKEAQARGGMPLAILKARYALKHALREQAGVPFQEVPSEPNLDYSPLPLYEAGRMAGSREEAVFEKWVLSNITICRDVAEFGVFSLALRAGALKQGQATPPNRPPEVRVDTIKPPLETTRTPTPPPMAPPPEPGGFPVVMVAGIAGALLALVVFGGLLMHFL